MSRLFKIANLTLYHGTCDRFLADINEKGILPPSQTNSMITGPASGGVMGVTNPYVVYLTNMEHIAEYYAQRAAQATGGNPVILSISVNKDDLVPDEDLENNAVYNSDTKTYTIHIPTTGETVEIPEDEFESIDGEGCLKLMHTCGFWGTIPSSAITNIQDI